MVITTRASGRAMQDGGEGRDAADGTRAALPALAAVQHETANAMQAKAGSVPAESLDQLANGGDTTSAAVHAAGDKQQALMVLDTFQQQAQLRAALKALDEQAAEPVAFLRPEAELALTSRRTAKALYQYAVAQLVQGHSSNDSQQLFSTTAPLPELYVDSFDAEQIWLQLELHTEVALRRVRRLLKRAANIDVIVKPEFQSHIDDLAHAAAGGETDSEAASDDEAHKDSEEDASSSGGSIMDEGMEERGDSDEGEGEEEQAARPAKRARPRVHPAEDAFMRFADMEKFLRNAEERRGDSGEEEEGEDDEGKEHDEGEGFEGADEGEMDDEERQMEALLNAAHPAGGHSKPKSVLSKNGRSSSSGGDVDKAMYHDFFGEEPDDAGDEEEGEEASEEEEEDAGTEEADAEGNAAAARNAGAAGPSNAAGARRAADEAALSTHERRLARMQERIAEMEAAALGTKDWHLRGEADAAKRPLNSALEIDLDFESSAKPPPQPTEEVAADLEAMIKARVGAHSFDDVKRRVAPLPERQTKAIELDDEKSKKGLGEVYEEQYVAAVLGGSGTAEDKDQKVREEAKTLFLQLCGKLDALSHFHYTPKPVVADMTVRSEVPAIVMEEAGPLAASAANVQLPGEVFKPEAGGAPRAEGELDREDRKRRRAQKKRASKARTAQKEADRRNRPVTEGGEANIIGRKSDAARQVAAQQKGASGKKGTLVMPAAGDAAGGGRSDFGKSRAVFAKLQEQQDIAKAGIKQKLPKDVGAPATKSSLALKL